ncbi:MAG: A/G-specific adenine glycosylase [Syntrophobacterales bacterium]|nr:MAG: A/G-specific adenine glycosylase [Syntrophobacterales bacterium]
MERSEELDHISMYDRTVLTTRRAAAFRTTVYDYYEKYGRSFPWRETTYPYRILVSEVMLQQTQAPRVLLKYEAFLRLFPAVSILASAPLHDILGAWQGLGYNRRALALKQSAQRIVTHHDGIVPQDEKSLVSLPGVGPATARAILAFAFNKPVILIETNIRAVFIHHFFPDEETVADSNLLSLIEKTLDRNNPRRWYNALMDYGTFLKKAHANPARRSAHHQRQSPFEGSVRQVRGAILRLILEKVKIPKGDLVVGLSFDGDTVGEVLDQLEREDIIVTKDGYISIA